MNIIKNNIVEPISRLFKNANKVNLSNNELNKMPQSYNIFTKHYIAKRQTILSFIIIIYIINMIYDIIFFVNLTSNINNTKIITNKSKINLCVIIFLLIFIEFINLCCHILARYYWNNYLKSNKIILISAFFRIYVNFIFMFIPYTLVIKKNTDEAYINTIFEDSANYIGFMFSLFEFIYLYMIRNILIIQVFITQSISFFKTFNSYEYKIVAQIMTLAFIPIVTFIISIIYQISIIFDNVIYNIIDTHLYGIIILLWIFYIGLLVIQLFNNKFCNYLKNFISVCLLLIIIYLPILIKQILKIDVNLNVTNIIISYFTMYIFINDICMFALIMNKKNKNEISINNFINDIQKYDNNYQNIEMVENNNLNLPLNI